MHCRSAFFIGSVDFEALATFQSQIEGAVVDEMLNLPGIKRLQIKWAKEIEEGGPAILVTLEYYFDSKADLERASSSDAGVRVREAVGIAMPHFKGKVVHVNSENHEYEP
jgi:hypothetical protein